MNEKLIEKCIPQNPYTKRIADKYEEAKGILSPDVTLDSFREAIQDRRSELYPFFHDHYLFEAERVFDEASKTTAKEIIPLIAEEILEKVDKFVGQNTFGGIVRSHHFRVEAWQNLKQALRTRYLKE